MSTTATITWNRYPEIKPESVRHYLVVCRGYYEHKDYGTSLVDTAPYMQMSLWFQDEFHGYSGNQVGMVLAWTEVDIPDWITGV
jgi:hypothetical protein